MTVLHIFDMDGTLLSGSACLHISEHLGKLKEVLLIEEAWSRGEVGHVEFYELCLPLWSELDPTSIAAVFSKVPWLDNVEKVFRDIASRGEKSAVITLSPEFFVSGLLDWGVTTAHGAVVTGGAIPHPDKVLTPRSKVMLARELMATYSLQASDCIAYGDSASDIPLFGFLSQTVAINASVRLKEIAATAYDGNDLWEAYQVGRSLVERPHVNIREGTDHGNYTQ